MSGIEDLTLSILRQIREDIATTRADIATTRAELSARMDAMEERIGQRFAAVDQRFDEMNRHLEGLAAQHRLLTRYVVNTVTEHERQLVELRARL